MYKCIHQYIYIYIYTCIYIESRVSSGDREFGRRPLELDDACHLAAVCRREVHLRETAHVISELSKQSCRWMRRERGPSQGNKYMAQSPLPPPQGILWGPREVHLGVVFIYIINM